MGVGAADGEEVGAETTDVGFEDLLEERPRGEEGGLVDVEVEGVWGIERRGGDGQGGEGTGGDVREG